MTTQPPCDATRLVVFDFDGTLADSLSETIAVYNDEADTAPDLPRLRAMRPWDVLRALHIPMWKVPLILAAVRRGMRDRIERVEPFAGVGAAVSGLRQAGARCAILSSNGRGNVERFLARHAMDEFEWVQCGASAFGKASRLRSLLKSLKPLPAASCYVGDEVRDVVAAEEVGLRSVAVTWGYSSRSALEAARPDLLVDTPEQLAAVLAATPRD
jgi:phosphoglycolate phosphatase